MISQKHKTGLRLLSKIYPTYVSENNSKSTLHLYQDIVIQYIPFQNISKLFLFDNEYY